MWIGGPAGVQHALQVAGAGADQHAAGKQVARVKAADGLQVDISVVGDVADQKADFVHMAKQHDFCGRSAFCGVALAQERAHCVNFDFIEQAVDLGLDQVAHAVFVARNARSFAQSFEQGQVHLSSFGPQVMTLLRPGRKADYPAVQP